jgi:hypothetical protein
MTTATAAAAASVVAASVKKACRGRLFLRVDAAFTRRVRAETAKVLEIENV